MFRRDAEMEYWRDPNWVGIPHGFFTRKGGQSAPPIAALNCGYGADEPAPIVDANRAQIVTALGGRGALEGVHQCHSARVVTIDAPQVSRPEADALVTRTKGLALGILTADCGPLLFADERNGVIGAAHAGWRGALEGVIEATIDAMRAIGAREISARLGPTISQANYEVGGEFVENFIAEDTAFGEYFSGAEKIYFNLPRFILDRCRKAGVEGEWIGECTYADATRYYSYRRATHRGEANYGRLASAIMLPLGAG